MWCVKLVSWCLACVCLSVEGSWPDIFTSEPWSLALWWRRYVSRRSWSRIYLFMSLQQILRVELLVLCKCMFKFLEKPPKSFPEGLPHDAFSSAVNNGFAVSPSLSACGSDWFGAIAILVGGRWFCALLHKYSREEVCCLWGWTELDVKHDTPHIPTPLPPPPHGEA